MGHILNIQPLHFFLKIMSFSIVNSILESLQIILSNKQIVEYIKGNRSTVYFILSFQPHLLFSTQLQISSNKFIFYTLLQHAMKG